MSKMQYFTMILPNIAFKTFAIIGTLLCAGTVSSGDPCPPKSELTPCTCSQVPLNRLFGNSIVVTTPLTKEVAREKSEVRSETNLVKHRAVRETSLTTPFPQQVNDSYYTVVTCNVPKSLSVIEEVMSNGLNRRWVDKLIVSNLPPKKEHTLVNLPPRWLKNLRVKQFEIKDTLLAGDFIFTGSPFEGQDQSLVWFAARNCYLSGGLTYDTIGTVNTRGLNTLPRVEGVDFSKNHLVFIHALGFRYPSANLTTIILAYNSIRGIEAGAFQYIPKLAYVDLSHNLLEAVSRGIFASPARYIQHLDFSWNHLTILPADFFVNLPSLKIVNFSNNFLYALPDKPWAPVWRQLTFVNMIGNFLACDCSLMWLLPILSPPEVNVTTTPAPRPLDGQTVLGSCSYTEPQIYTQKFSLVNLTRSSLNCES